MPEYTYSRPEIANLMGLVDTYIRWKEKDNDRAFEIYHPSAFGKCLRMMQYQRYESRGLIKGDKEVFNGEKLRLFANGHGVHERWASYFTGLGILRGLWVCKNPLCRLFDASGKMVDDHEDVAHDILKNPKSYEPRIFGLEHLHGAFKPNACQCGCTKFKYEEVAVVDTELNFKGHADMLLDFSRFDPSMFDDEQKKGLCVMFDPKQLPTGVVVVDMKSCGVNQYKNVVKKTGPHKYYQVQLTIYVNVLKCSFGILIYEEKDQFELSAYEVQANPEWWEAVRKQSLLMNEMANGTKPLLPPPRPISKSGFECEKCAFKTFCHKKGGIWDDPELDAKRREFYGVLL